MSRKLEEKQARREADERKRREQARERRRRNLLTLGAALIVGALVVFLILNERSGTNGSVDTSFGVTAEAADCTGIETHQPEGQDHVDDGAPTNFGTTPPTSGNHYADWADPGFHTETVADGNAVHNLEHGQIVVWYNPDAPPGVLDNLETYVDDAGLPMLAVPYGSVPAGSNFTLTAWGASESCVDVSGAVLAEFRERFQGKGPEQVGTPTFETGGDA